jgi:IS5 family transposase
MDNDYIATVTLDRSKVQIALSEEQQKYSMSQEVATHGAQIAALFNMERALVKSLAETNNKLASAAKDFNVSSADVNELQRAVRFLQWYVVVLSILLVGGLWLR